MQGVHFAFLPFLFDNLGFRTLNSFVSVKCNSELHGGFMYVYVLSDEKMLKIRGAKEYLMDKSFTSTKY